MTASTERPTPETDAAYAVQMSNGYYVGIWREKEIADAICAKAPGLKGDRAVELVPADALPAERAARERAEAERDALAEALRRIACYPATRSDEISIETARKLARDALAALERGNGKEGS